MSPLWMISISLLWCVVLCETFLLILLLNAIGKLKIEGFMSKTFKGDSIIGGLDIGDYAPSFPVRDQSGIKTDLKEFNGRKRLLTFVSPGCSACFSAMQALRDISKKEKSIEILVVGSVDKDANRVYEDDLNGSIQILTPEQVNVAKDFYRVEGVPLTFAISEDNIVVAKKIVNQVEHLQEILVNSFPEIVLS